jgi:hypothetical protein
MVNRKTQPPYQFKKEVYCSSGENNVGCTATQTCKEEVTMSYWQKNKDQRFGSTTYKI